MGRISYAENMQKKLRTAIMCDGRKLVQVETITRQILRSWILNITYWIIHSVPTRPIPAVIGPARSTVTRLFHLLCQEAKEVVDEICSNSVHQITKACNSSRVHIFITDVLYNLTSWHLQSRFSFLHYKFSKILLAYLKHSMSAMIYMQEFNLLFSNIHSITKKN
jgi:hypothetical protein